MSGQNLVEGQSPIVEDRDVGNEESELAGRKSELPLYAEVPADLLPVGATSGMTATSAFRLLEEADRLIGQGIAEGEVERLLKVRFDQIECMIGLFKLDEEIKKMLRSREPDCADWSLHDALNRIPDVPALEEGEVDGAA